MEGGLLRVGALSPYPYLVHGISTRTAPDGTDWNLTARRGSPQHPPDPAVALANREKMAALLGVPPGSMVGCRQVHTAVVATAGPADVGRGMFAEMPSFEGADAMVTDTPGLTLLVLSADCPPVFFYDPVQRAIGLAHSGWKGTVGRISANVVQAMRDNYGSQPADIVAVVGPSIGPCCYAVGANVIEAAEAEFPGAWEGSTPLLERRNDQVYFSLPEAIRRTLLDAGLSPQNIAVEGVCTSHNRDLFYSHRGDEGQCGLFGAALGLVAPTNPPTPTQ